MFDYPVTLTPDGAAVLVTFSDVPEAVTFGADEGEAASYRAIVSKGDGDIGGPSNSQGCRD